MGINILYDNVRKYMRMSDCYISDRVAFSDPITYFTNFGEVLNMTITSKEDTTFKREV